MITPMTSIQIPRRIAQATRAMIAPLILVMTWQRDYLSVWHQVYREPVNG